MPRMTTQRHPMNWQFTTKIYKQGIQPYLDLPTDTSHTLSEAGQTTGYLPVKGQLNECDFRALLVPRSGGGYRLFVNSYMRRTANVAVGDVVSVSLQLDKESREMDVPADLAEIFAEDAEARTTFEKLTTAKRNEIIKWLEQAKKDETRLKRLEHIYVYLTTGRM